MSARAQFKTPGGGDIQTKIQEGWEKIRVNAISKLESFLTTGKADNMFSKKEWMDYYT